MSDRRTHDAPGVPRCAFYRDGRRCIYAEGHNGRHQYPPRVTPSGAGQKADDA